MKSFCDFLRNVDWISLGIELGIGLFVLITLVRCALGD